MIVDDYAHHPSEIVASLEGVKQGFDNRIVAVFQPHLFSRTRDFHVEFGKAFLDTDLLYVTGIYPAREKPIEGVTGRMVADAAKSAGHRNVTYLEDDEELLGELVKNVRQGDLVITFGAGDVNRIGNELLKRLTDR